MAQSTARQIEALERTFWQSMVDGDPAVATDLLTEPALMVSGHGVNRFDHAGYTRMAKDGRYRLLAYTLSDFSVLTPTADVAVAAYRVHQSMEMDGKPVEMDAIDSSTWVRDGDDWRCVAHTESAVVPKA